MASCHTPVSEGMYIYTHSANINKLRKNIIELVLTDHPLECLTCNEVNNNCELQSVAASVGITEVRYPQGIITNIFKRFIPSLHDFGFVKMHQLLSLCSCCDEIQGQFVLNMAGRGLTIIIKAMMFHFMDSDCGVVVLVLKSLARPQQYPMFLCQKSVQSTEKHEQSVLIAVLGAILKGCYKG